MRRKGLIIVSVCILIQFVVVLLSVIQMSQLGKIEETTTSNLSVINNTIDDIDETNKKLDFERQKYIYEIYKKYNDFTVLERDKKYLAQNVNSQKFNMMKNYNFI